MEILNKIKEVINSSWFGAAAAGAAGVFVLLYGYKLYAGLLLGWGACNAYKWLKSLNG